MSGIRDDVDGHRDGRGGGAAFGCEGTLGAGESA